MTKGKKPRRVFHYTNRQSLPLRGGPSASIGPPLLAEEGIYQRIPPLTPDKRIPPEMTLKTKPDASDESL
jgi:hypothetical protein